MDLTIIILSYSTKNITNECLNKLLLSVNSCQKRLGNKIQTIVLDNASDDSSVDMIKKKHPWVELIESRENTGYSKGNNLAFKRVKFPIVLFLNSDVYVDENTLERALSYFKNPDCSVLGAKLKFENGKFQPSAGNLPNPINTIFWIMGLSSIPIIEQFTHPIHPKYKEFFVSPTVVKVGWVTGAFFMVRKEVFEKTGGFDENLFMYSEEVELCKRISSQGIQIWYVPSLEVTHLHGASSDFNPNLALVSELKGVKYYFKKYYSIWYTPVRIFLILGLILRIIIFSFLGQTKKARVYFEGLGVI